MALSVGEVVLGRYVVEGLVGVGGMGEVYRARHQALGIPVAIKVMVGDASPDLVQRFGREAMLLARVRHPNVVSILDVGQTDDGSPCMAMEFLEGEGLDRRLERRKALPWAEARVVGLSVLMGLDAVHTAGIVHRDLKPSNVFATRGTPEVIKLVDFGIAYSTAANAAKYTRTGAVVGTPAYMSPEQLVGADVDVRGDLYALGLMLYECVTGHLPFGDEPSGALRRLREPVPAPVAPDGLPAIPPQVSTAIESALAIEPEQRPSSAKTLYSLLRGAPRGEATLQQRKATHQGQPPTRPVPPPVPRPDAFAATSVAAAPKAAAPAVRTLIAARLPVSRMSREEQKTLAQLAAPGRAYHMGGGMWFAVLPAASEKESRAAVDRLRAALASRYGETCKVAWAPASSGFALTPASLAGAAPLPEEISKLLERLL